MKSAWSQRRAGLCVGTSLLLGGLVCLPTSRAQLPKPAAPAQAAQSQSAQASPDPLGRTTPRGAVLGFLSAAYEQKYDLAAQYLNTSLRGKDAASLAQKLSLVLDRRLPAKLGNLSNDPQGSMSDPLDVRRERIGTVASDNGNVDIYLERINRPNATAIWLFSRQTLASIPDLYDEINANTSEIALPQFFWRKFLGLSIFAWLFYFVALPLGYMLLGVANRLVAAGVGRTLRRVRKRPEIADPPIFPHPIRLLLLAIAVDWMVSHVTLTLMAREIGSVTATLVLIVALCWLVIMINARVEVYLKKRMESQGRLGSTAILRPLRSVADFLVGVIGFMFVLHTFGINPSAALAGLGVGGIAIALAAQKTLENVIGGASLILDEAVRVGDSIKVGEVVGTVESIGLRSTRVRTNDRTLVTIPNGQMATMTLENFSARDNFWLRQMIGLGYNTAPSTLTSVLADVRRLLEQDRRVLPSSPRVRLLRFSQSNLDLEIIAYIYARDWNHFLEIQEELLIRIKEAIVSAGVEIAFPTSTVYVRNELPADSRSPEVLDKLITSQDQ